MFEWIPAFQDILPCKFSSSCWASAVGSGGGGYSGGGGGVGDGGCADVWMNSRIPGYSTL